MNNKQTVHKLQNRLNQFQKVQFLDLNKYLYDGHGSQTFQLRNLHKSTNLHNDNQYF